MRARKATQDTRLDRSRWHHWSLRQDQCGNWRMPFRR